MHEPTPKFRSCYIEMKIVFGHSRAHGQSQAPWKVSSNTAIFFFLSFVGILTAA